MKKILIYTTTFTAFIFIVIAIFFQFFWVESISLTYPYVSGNRADIPPYSKMVEPITGIEFIWIPGGSYEMGAIEQKTATGAMQIPGHKISVDGFWAATTQTTIGQFKIFIAQTGYKTLAERKGWSYLYKRETQKWEKSNGIFWANSGMPQDDNHPVVHIAYEDAMAMATWLTEKVSGMVRLPTEAEWEYACRSGTKTASFWGQYPDVACTYANVHDFTSRSELYLPFESLHMCNDGAAYTTAVGSYKPNPNGLFDMIGNVWEWVLDDYSEDAYVLHPEKNPIVKTRFTWKKLFRGGAWCSIPSQGATCIFRYPREGSRRNCDLGFRLVLIPTTPDYLPEQEGFQQ